MAAVYASLIRKELKTFKQVPELLQDEVERLLIASGDGDLVVK